MEQILKEKMKYAVVKQTFALIPIYINFAMVCCSSNWLANAAYFLTKPGHQPSATVAQCAWMESCYQIGRFVFAIPGGILADKYGKKKIIIGIGCIQLVTWVAMSTCYTTNILLVVRFFQGFAASLSTVTGGSAIGEISSPQYREFFVVLYGNVGTLGIIIECLLSSIFDSYWITIYAITAITFLFFPTIPWITESPYYLLRKANYEEAQRTLKKIRKGFPEDEIVAEYESMKRSVEYDETVKSNNSWIGYFKLKSTRKPLICGILLNFLVFANGTNVILLYASVIFPSNEYFSNHFYPLILSLIQMLSSMSAVLLIAAFPRRYFFMLASFLSFLIQSFNGISFYEYSKAEIMEEQNIWRWTFIIGTLMFWILANAVIAPLNIAIRTEIFPFSIRGLGMSICSICQSISAILCYQIFIFVQDNFGMAVNYAIFALNSVLMIAVVFFFVPETRGKTLAEVQSSNHGDEIVKIDKKVISTITSTDKK